ncbi:DHA1 family chloramphenicol resistance protein-like MFS transporter [Stackebrandtia albiflava]|uniref:DHA1 family chloramphenicol resistance protein-like MFS transporter n=1 Tax=Stackebrandtia albiflava TaxID=406432 RepID=A0A562V414_9ACTN|nr:Cmx/CmrA family chloramphenicol efflux MFS transporter [Stackebrandtia albiflava]TWJ12639.1 DHA1 family chloramphenicol resistance protein-like MFS transporter [Stackebrandtia albiflava]
MPVTVYLLALAVFAQGTSEFMLSGLGPRIAADLDVSIASTGLLTTGFAAGMVVGAPVMAALAGRWPRRAALTAFLSLFVVAHLAAAVADDLWSLVALRVVGALANAGFLAVALTTVAELAGPARQGRATAVLLGGVTTACVAGVPAGAVLAQEWGWRASFLAVAVLASPVLWAIRVGVPAGGAARAAGTLGPELRALADRRLIAVLVSGAAVNGATFCTFTYVAPMVTGVWSSPEWLTAPVLALFGAGAFTGVAVAGRFADRFPARLAVAGAWWLPVGWASLAWAGDRPAVALPVLFVQAVVSFAVGSTLISQTLHVARSAPTLAGGYATAAFNVGAAVGPALGGAAIAVWHSVAVVPWTSAGLAVVAVVSLPVARRAFSRPGTLVA